jgi:glycosyl transferase family 25
MTDLSLPVFAICLEKEIERKELLKKNLAELRLRAEYVGVDGNALPDDFQHRYSATESLVFFGRELGASEIGCYASHITCWNRIVDNNIDYAIIMESDAILSTHSINTIEAILKSNTEWDLIQLSWWNCIPSFWQRKKLSSGNSLVRFARKTYKTSAYLIKYSGAKELLKHSKTMIMPVDHMMFTGKVKKEMSIYGVYPLCVNLLKNNLETSLLENERNKISEKVCFAKNKKKAAFRKTVRIFESSIRHFFLKIGKVPDI